MAMNIKITEYEVEVEDYSPERTKQGQLVIYLCSNSESKGQIINEETDEKLQSLIYRTKITFQSDDTTVIFYADAGAKARVDSGIAFVSLHE
jgi:hypothetical protein